MRVLIDADIVLDVYLKRQPHFAASNQVLCLARRNAISGAVASHTIANLFYLCGKRVVPFFQTRLLNDVEVVAADAYGVKTSLAWGFGDLEDALQAAAAVAWKSSFLVTRNVRDYRRAPVPALSPGDFLRRFFAA
jgi:hypothetical protein